MFELNGHNERLNENLKVEIKDLCLKQPVKIGSPCFKMIVIRNKEHKKPRTDYVVLLVNVKSNPK